MKRIHLASGLLLSLFIGAHLLNHLISLISIEDHIQFMNMLRIVYRNPIGESVLFLAVIVQIHSGIQLLRKNTLKRIPIMKKIQLISGAYMSAFFLFHIGAVLMGRWGLHLDTNFYFGVAGLNQFPLNLFFFPYYGIAVLSFFTHIGAIHYHKRSDSPLRHIESMCIFGVGLFTLLLIFYGATDGFQGVSIPKEYLLVD